MLEKMVIELFVVVWTTLNKLWYREHRVAVCVLIHTFMVFTEEFNDSCEEVRSDVTNGFRRKSIFRVILELFLL